MKGAPDKARTIQKLATSAWHAHALPRAWSRPRGHGGLRPAELHVAGRCPHLRRRGRHRDGQTDIIKYVAVDDCGTVMNPMIVEGQIHGGVAQGIAEALYEEAIYDEPGNLTRSTMTQYLVPSAVRSRTRPTDTTPSTTNARREGHGEAARSRRRRR